MIFILELGTLGDLETGRPAELFLAILSSCSFSMLPLLVVIIEFRWPSTLGAFSGGGGLKGEPRLFFEGFGYGPLPFELP